MRKYVQASRGTIALLEINIKDVILDNDQYDKLAISIWNTIGHIDIEIRTSFGLIKEYNYSDYLKLVKPELCGD